MDESGMSAEATHLATRRRSLEAAFSVLGWELLNVEVDAVRGTARIDAKRDGRLVILHVDRLGRAQVERFVGAHSQRVTGRRGDRFIAYRLDLDFLGRERFKTPREALRGFVGYLAHNGAPGAEALEGAVAALLTGGA